MSNIENISKSRPACKYPVNEVQEGKPTNNTKSCGSEEHLFNVKGTGKYTGIPRETPVCGKHLPDAIKNWHYDSAEPIKNKLVK